MSFAGLWALRVPIALALILSALAGGVVYAKHQHVRAVAAEAASERLAASLVIMQANAETSRAIESAGIEKSRKRMTALQIQQTEVRRVPTKPVPVKCAKACADHFAPVARAVGGLRSLRAEAGGSPASDAAVRR